jgi:hypothetical protein
VVCERFKQAGCMFSFAEGHNERYCLRLLLWAYLRPKTKGHKFKLKIPTSHSESTHLQLKAHIYSLHAARTHVVS